MRLALADLGGEDGDIEALGEPHPLEILAQEPPWVERVRDEPEAEASIAEAVEERVRLRAHLPRRVPGGVLGLEEARELLV